MPSQFRGKYIAAFHWADKASIMWFSDLSIGHIKLNISCHNSASHVGTLVDTNN